jgi:hypothetical protein
MNVDRERSTNAIKIIYGELEYAGIYISTLINDITNDSLKAGLKPFL